MLFHFPTNTGGVFSDYRQGIVKVNFLYGPFNINQMIGNINTLYENLNIILF